MNTPDINALRNKVNEKDDDSNEVLIIGGLIYLYLSPLMILMSLVSGFNYKFIELIRIVFIPFQYIKADDYWGAFWIVIGNIMASVILLLALGMLSETIDNGIWDTEMEFDWKVVMGYIIIFLTFFVFPLSQPW